MKKFHLFACCFLFALAIIAQPGLQYPQNAPEVGDEMEIQFVSPLGISHLPIGPDVSWDFSQLNNMGNPGTVTAITPAGDEFPTANVVLSIGDSIFTYVMHDENAAYYLGIQMITGDYEALLIYSDTRKYLEYPFTYNDVFSDTYKGVSVVSVVEVRQSASSTVTADSYGTLTLPTGTFTDVLRITTVDNTIDSIFVGGFLTSVSSGTRTQYAWYGPLSSGPLFSMEIINESGEIDTACYYTTAEAGIRTYGNNPVTGMKIFPNPAEDYLFVEFETSDNRPITISIVNQVGQVMISKVLTVNVGSITEKIDIRDLPSGIYFANISCNCIGQLTDKFIIR